MSRRRGVGYLRRRTEHARLFFLLRSRRAGRAGRTFRRRRAYRMRFGHSLLSLESRSGSVLKNMDYVTVSKIKTWLPTPLYVPENYGGVDRVFNAPQFRGRFQDDLICDLGLAEQKLKSIEEWATEYSIARNLELDLSFRWWTQVALSPELNSFAVCSFGSSGRFHWDAYKRKEFKGKRSETRWTLHSFNDMPAHATFVKNSPVFSPNGNDYEVFDWVGPRKDGGPSVCSVTKNHSFASFEWINEKGNWHRNQAEGPAIIRFDAEKSELSYGWFENHVAIKPHEVMFRTKLLK